MADIGIAEIFWFLIKAAIALVLLVISVYLLIGLFWLSVKIIIGIVKVVISAPGKLVEWYEELLDSAVRRSNEVIDSVVRIPQKLKDCWIYDRSRFVRFCLTLLALGALFLLVYLFNQAIV